MNCLGGGEECDDEFEGFNVRNDDEEAFVD